MTPASTGTTPSSPAATWLIGLSISLLVAVGVGAVMASSRFIEEATQPVLILILVTPWVAYVTSVVIWLDFGEAPIVFMVAFTVVSRLHVRRGRRHEVGRPGRSRTASRPSTRAGGRCCWRLRLPAALPSIFTTARFAIGLGLAAAYFSEGAALSNDGLGAVGERAAAFNNGEVALGDDRGDGAARTRRPRCSCPIAERLLLRWHVSQR